MKQHSVTLALFISMLFASQVFAAESGIFWNCSLNVFRGADTGGSIRIEGHVPISQGSDNFFKQVEFQNPHIKGTIDFQFEREATPHRWEVTSDAHFKVDIDAHAEQLSMRSYNADLKPSLNLYTHHMSELAGAKSYEVLSCSFSIQQL